MATFCPRCGAQFPLDLATQLAFNVRCSGCRLAFTEVEPMLAPAENEDDEIGYELTDWAVGDRGQVSALLMEHDIPYRWEAGLVLVVPADLEERVDGLLDGLDSEPAGAASSVVDPAGGESSGEGGAPSGGDADHDEGAAEEFEEEDGGEEAQAAMAELFVAADRLQHQPFDLGAATDLRTAAEIVSASRPPYGIEGGFWGRLRELAGAVITVLDENAEDDRVAEEARALRDVLRDYV